LSFSGINAGATLFTQTIYEPLDPSGLAQQDGWVVLINVDHTSNTSIHYAEKLAGRKQFTRWALMETCGRMSKITGRFDGVSSD
jgi:aminoglycoside 3-N-acetyltransferase